MIVHDKEFVGYALASDVVDRVTALEEMLYGELAYEETYAKILGWSIDGVQNYERVYGTDDLLYEIEQRVYGFSDEEVNRLYVELARLRSRW